MKRLLLLLLAAWLLAGCADEPSGTGGAGAAPMTEDTAVGPSEDPHDIYFAGGCFWGVEAYFERLPGVLDAESGYANGEGEATYANIMRNETGYAETVRVTYNRNAVSLPVLTSAYLRIIDPFSVNRQGNDFGTQYRTGVFAEKEEDLNVVRAVLAEAQARAAQPFAVETELLSVYHPAEEEHQDYLTKNPSGYCHVDLNLADRPLLPGSWEAPPDAELREILTPLQYRVTREKGTEPAFDNPYDEETRPGIYVDITSGQPLFRSDDKYDSGTGWPSFTKGITPDAFDLEEDTSLGMRRIAVSAKGSGAHLGHVFPDGPAQSGGLRFCMNSAAMRFIPVEEMEKEGYGAFVPWLEDPAE